MNVVPSFDEYLSRLGFKNIDEWAASYDCYTKNKNGEWCDDEGDPIDINNELDISIREVFYIESLTDWAYSNGIYHANEYDHQMKSSDGLYFGNTQELLDYYWDLCFEEEMDSKKSRQYNRMARVALLN
jgi:hypothetical protein